MRHIDLFKLTHVTQYSECEFPIDEIYVPLKVSPRGLYTGFGPLDRHDPDLRPESEEKRQPKPLGEILTCLFQVSIRRCLLLLGKPGAGKTTLLKYLAYHYANGSQQDIEQALEPRVPIFLRVKEMASWIDDKAQLPYVVQQVIHKKIGDLCLKSLLP